MDKINPPHYQKWDVEVFDMMRKIWGDEQVAIYCKMNAFKYQMRMGSKTGESTSDDMGKRDWYLTKFKELEANK